MRARVVVTVLATVAVVLVPVARAETFVPRGQRNSRDAAALADFGHRVQAYATLHREIEGPIPTVQMSDNPDDIKAAMRSLAARILSVRRGNPGDFFTPEVTPVIRRLIREGCGPEGYQELLAIVTEEAPPGLPRPRVNEPWPEQAPFSMVPPGVLCALPELPEELEYRFVNRDLVLRDMHADLVLDVLINAIPTGT